MRRFESSIANRALLKSASSSATVPRQFVFLLADGLSMMSLSSAIEPLRSANRLAGETLYAWTLASLDGEPAPASNGIALAARKFDDVLAGADYVFVCGGLRLAPALEPAFVAALRRAARTGAVIGSLSTGTYLLALAGLLDGYQCTIHWENLPAFTEAFPDLLCSSKLYEIDRDRMTCSGGIASMDLMLHLIKMQHGSDLAVRVANQFHHERMRDTADSQRGWRDQNHASLPRGIRRAIEMMRAHVETPLQINDIGSAIGMTSRQMERLFLRHLNATPARYYVQLRLERAHEMLTYSSVPVADVAVATGFASPSHLARWVRRAYGTSPTELRAAQTQS
ncbi:GlxA family transcriptional regulator [Caballeronia sp. LZ001]|uniref:GlxA family transcriptional regulator n=1 Tax=Caballeronia sp. LZ001 TaxID=3038553 RepID=UPI002864EB99|nr:GlxA family transcriptional regulator [Caballeronia sp. LZ001]MDR5806028.1 GlxA family transcriptional regulator [Caballeronia sp. LZ001]